MLISLPRNLLVAHMHYHIGIRKLMTLCADHIDRNNTGIVRIFDSKRNPINGFRRLGNDRGRRLLIAQLCDDFRLPS